MSQTQLRDVPGAKEWWQLIDGEAPTDAWIAATTDTIVEVNQ